MVVLLHVSASGFHVFNGIWWAANFWDSLTRSCVPLFFMIAGATLLPKKESSFVFFKKRFVRIIPPLLFWSCISLGWLQYNGVAVGNWVIAILKGPTSYHLWYFYAIIGLYAFMPFLRKIYQNSNSNERNWFVAIWFTVASLYPTLHTLFYARHCEGYIGSNGFVDVYNLSYFGGYIGYFFLGAIFYEKKVSQKLGVALFAMASAGTVVATSVISNQFKTPCEFFYVYLSPLVVMAACGLFIAFMGMREGTPSRLTSTLADCSLGIYCIHAFVINPLFLRYITASISANYWFATLPIAIAVFVVSFTLIFLGRKVGFGRYVT